MDFPKHLPGGKFARITNLSQERQEELADLLRRGIGYGYIVRKIQDEWGESTDVKPRSLEGLIRAWRDEVIPDLDVVENVSPKTAAHITERAVRHVDVLEEYSKMIRIQADRIEKARQREEQTGFLLDVTEKAMGTMSTYLRDYGNLAVKVGVAQRMLEGNENEGGRYRPAMPSEAFFNEEIRGEMLEVVEGMLADLGALDGEVVEEPEDGDGDR